MEFDHSDLDADEQPSFECPRCGGRWDSIDEFEEEAFSLEAIYENCDGINIPDPPFDSIAAILSTPMEYILEDQRERGAVRDPDFQRIHCARCALEMLESNREVAFNSAFMAGVKAVDDVDEWPPDSLS